MKNQKPLSQKLYELRKEHNFNIAAFARAIKVSRSMVYAMENGANKPSYNTISKICRFYNLDPRELIEL